MSFESATTLFTFLNLDLVMVEKFCVCLHQVPVAPAAEPEVAFLVHFVQNHDETCQIHSFSITAKTNQSFFMPHLEAEFTSCLCNCAYTKAETPAENFEAANEGIARMKAEKTILLRYRIDWLLSFRRPRQVENTYRNAKRKVFLHLDVFGIRV